MSEKLYRFINSKLKNDFLNYYIRTGTISKAAKRAHISRQTHYDWMRDEKYAEAFAKADTMAADLLEEEAWNRAVNGCSQAIYYKGEKIGTKKVMSDYLLAFLLKGKKPHIYRENTEVNTNVNVNLSDAVQAARERVENAKANQSDQS